MLSTILPYTLHWVLQYGSNAISDWSRLALCYIPKFIFQRSPGLTTCFHGNSLTWSLENALKSWRRFFPSSFLHSSLQKKSLPSFRQPKNKTLPETMGGKVQIRKFFCISAKSNKVVLYPRVSPDFVINKTPKKIIWPLDDLWCKFCYPRMICSKFEWN